MQRYTKGVQGDFQRLIRGRLLDTLDYPKISGTTACMTMTFLPHIGYLTQALNQQYFVFWLKSTGLYIEVQNRE